MEGCREESWRMEDRCEAGWCLGQMVELYEQEEDVPEPRSVWADSGLALFK